MDFIVKLLRLKDFITMKKYNAILIIVDRLTKYFYIILFKKYIYSRVNKKYYT